VLKTQRENKSGLAILIGAFAIKLDNGLWFIEIVARSDPGFLQAMRAVYLHGGLLKENDAQLCPIVKNVAYEHEFYIMKSAG
jgi:hypothetical protein